ncbi:MAG TPA: class I SAM-dependent methyltransferase, partial [Anaerolineales bacterium]|nr:class I SAM-dependent methyltransferase [Anaerolineales bacterium]
MTRLTGQKRAAYVQNMFSRIAGRYDLMNRLMTAGQDIRWRKQVIRRAQLKNDSCLLDIGTGTGDLAREALAQYPQLKVIAADFTQEMMRVGQKNGALDFSSADTLFLPFE